MRAMNRRVLKVLEGRNKLEGIISFVAKVVLWTFFLRFFRDTVWGLLTGQITDATPSIVLHDVREIETWILRLLSAPVPIPGKTK